MTQKTLVSGFRLGIFGVYCTLSHAPPTPLAGMREKHSEELAVFLIPLI